MAQAKAQGSRREAKAESKLHDKSFRDLFGKEELIHYGVAVVVYILLGLWLRDKILNVGVGPLYFIAWMWIVPPLVDRLRGRGNER